MSQKSQWIEQSEEGAMQHSLRNNGCQFLFTSFFTLRNVFMELEEKLRTAEPRQIMTAEPRQIVARNPASPSPTTKGT